MSILIKYKTTATPKINILIVLAYCISYSRRGMHYTGEIGTPLRTKFGEHRRAVNGNDADQPVARHYNTSNHSVSDMEI